MTKTMVLGAMVLCTILIVPGLLPGGEAKIPLTRSVFTVTSYDGGLPQMAVDLSPGTADDSVSITLPANAQVVNASMELTALPHTKGGVDYPSEPQMDIGADGSVEWAFRGFGYGAMGYQTQFHDGSKTAAAYNLSFSAGEQKVLRTRIPANASIVRASMSVGGWPAPFWRDPVRVTPGTGSPGENSPAFYDAGDRLWTAWASKDPTITDGPDWDIAVSWSFDGTTWAPPLEITSKGDMYEDDSPDIIGYGGKIYVAWSAAESESQFSASNIFIRSWDGTRWEDATRLTPPGLRYMNDGPQMIVYKNGLFMFWRTTDPSQSEIASTDDMDMVFRTFDGKDWSPIAELTPPSSTEIDWSLNLIEYDGRLFAIWDQDVISGQGFSVDIFYRSFDGARWTGAANIIPQPDHELDEIPKAAVYRNPVTGRNELWVAWIRGSPRGHDLHIMARRYDGSSWATWMELTDPSKPKDNMGQEIVEYDHRLYVVWVTGTNTTEETNETIAIYNTYGDVVIRAYDGYRWSDLMELTPGEENDNANSPAITLFGGKLYVGWAYPYPPPANGKETWDIIVRNIDFRQVVLEMDMGNDGLADWGPSALQSTNERIPIYGDELGQALGETPRTRDAYGNEYCDVDVRLRSIYPSNVAVGNLSIEYSYSVRFEDLSDILNGILVSQRGRGRADEGNITVPVRFQATSAGKLALRDLNVTYILNLAPVLIDEIPNLHFPEDTDAVRLIDIEDFFWDDWDDGRLAFEITYEEDAQFIHGIVDGRYLTFTTPTENWYGTERFRVRAQDRGMLIAPSNLFCITVDPVNDPPVLEPIDDQNVHVGDMVHFNAHASDVEKDPLTFSTNDSRFPILPMRDEGDSGYVDFVARRPGTYRINVTVDDGHGGTDTRSVAIRVQDKTSTSTVEACLSWLVILAISLAAGTAAEWYRRRYLKETGPVIGPGGEFTEEQAFGGQVAAVRLDVDVQGGSDNENASRASVKPKKITTAAEEKDDLRKKVEKDIEIPGSAKPSAPPVPEAARPPSEAVSPISEGVSGPPGQSIMPPDMEPVSDKKQTPSDTTQDPQGARDPLDDLLKRINDNVGN